MPTISTQNIAGHLSASEVSSEYLLVCRAQSISLDLGSWQFSLELTNGTSVLEASDEDSGDLNRLTLLAAVRGLEAIDGPSSVTMISNNRYMIRSLSDSLPRWRRNDFAWEHFGQRIAVQHADLWRRVDRAIAIHRVEACLIASRLISNGKGHESFHRELMGDPSAQAQSAPAQLRVDGPHSTPPASRQRPQGSRPFGGTSLPADGLRRWIRGATDSGRQLVSGHRFTAADLAGTA